VCRLCNCNLKVVYGNCVSKMSFINIFKPSSRQESIAIGVVWPLWPVYMEAIELPAKASYSAKAR
jgi:hypothetical protein